jgi:hypothetical protein
MEPETSTTINFVKILLVFILAKHASVGLDYSISSNTEAHARRDKIKLILSSPVFIINNLLGSIHLNLCFVKISFASSLIIKQHILNIISDTMLISNW